MFTHPPTVSRSLLTTNAVALTTTTHNIIATPGAGFALRIVGLHLMLRENAAAGAILRGVGRDTAGASPVDDLLVATGGSDHSHLPEPGIQLATNRGFDLVSVCSAAAQPFVLIVYYYTDPVT